MVGITYTWCWCFNHAMQPHILNRTATRTPRFCAVEYLFQIRLYNSSFPVLLFIFLAVKNSHRHKHPPEETRPVKSHVVHTGTCLTRFMCNHGKFYFPTISDCCFWIERIKTFLKVNKHTFTSVYTVRAATDRYIYIHLMCKSVGTQKQILNMEIGKMLKNKKKNKIKQNKNIVRPVSFDERWCVCTRCAR